MNCVSKSNYISSDKLKPFCRPTNNLSNKIITKSIVDQSQSSISLNNKKKRNLPLTQKKKNT